MSTVWNALYAGAVCCLMLVGCRNNKAEAGGESQSEAKAPADEILLTVAAQAQQKIAIGPVETGAAVSSQTAQGRIVLPDDKVWRVGVLAEGRVVRVYANLGDPVSKGQVLARYHSHEVHDVRASYANAVAEHTRLKAAEALAQKEYDRSERLYALKAASVSETEGARQALTNAQSAVREAANNVRAEQAHLEDLLDVRGDALLDESEEAELIPIKAPASGRILQKNITPGQTISSSTDTFIIGDLRRFWMLASVNAATLSRLHPGQTATVTIPDVPGASYAGTITNLGMEFDAVTRQAQIRITLARPDSRLRPEMLATAQFLAGNGESTLLIPQEAVQQVNGADVVFVQLTAERFKAQAVVTGEIVQNKIRVLDGLRPGERVIAQGSFVAKSQLLKSSIGD